MSIRIDLVTGGTRGLRHSAEIVHAVLSSSYRTEINVSRKRNAHLVHRRMLKDLATRLTGVRRIILFFEILPTGWMRIPSTRILVPNQEWMRAEVIKNLPMCSQVWCKTLYAEAIFQRRGHNARYIGFSSHDIYSVESAKDYNQFIHVAGRSHFKGTNTLLELWSKHPEWPSLTVVTSNSEWRSFDSHNIVVRHGYLADRELHALMNRCGIHLCPSETEGYGHYISEALSTKALVITVAAPPMNELIGPGLGLLAKHNRVEPFSFSERFFVDARDLERQIEAALQMSVSEKAVIGEAARAAYLKRHAAFEERLLSALKDVVTA